jgi:hypothetical protein
MTNSKHVLAVGLAGATLVLVLTNVIGGVTLLRAGLSPVIGFSTIGLATAVFVISWKQRSFLVAGLLAVSGVIGTIPGFIALANINFAVIVFPGPIIGVIYGLGIFGLGVAKGIRTARSKFPVRRSQTT